LNYEKLELNPEKEISIHKVMNDKIISDYSIEASIAIRNTFKINDHPISSINFFSSEEDISFIPEGFSPLHRFSLYSPATSFRINPDNSIDILVEPTYPMPFSRVVFSNPNNTLQYEKGEVIGICESILGENKVFYQIKSDKSEYFKVPTNQCVLDSDYKFLYFYEQEDPKQSPQIICAIRYCGELNNDIIRKSKEQFFATNNKYKIMEENSTNTFIVSANFPRLDKELKTDMHVRPKKWDDLAIHILDYNQNNARKIKP